MSGNGRPGMILVQTNEEDNAVVAFRRSGDGSLDRIGSFSTGGAGDGVPHLTSQASVAVTGDGRHLLVTNAGSGDISLFVVGDDGLELAGREPAGAAPKSVAVHDGLVYVLATGKPAVTGLRLRGDALEPLAGGEVALSAPGCDPAQVGFSPDGSTLLVTERGTDSISAFAVEPDGSLGPIVTIASSGPTPYGFACTATGALVVTEAFRAQKGAAAASSYSLRGTTLTPVTSSAGNGRSEICWAVVTPDGTSAFTTNFADGAVSRYAIGPDGALTLADATAGLSIDGRPGLRDEALTADGRHLYVLDADAGAIFGWALGADGSLDALGSWDGLPATAAGLAASRRDRRRLQRRFPTNNGHGEQDTAADTTGPAALVPDLAVSCAEPPPVGPTKTTGAGCVPMPRLQTTRHLTASPAVAKPTGELKPGGLVEPLSGSGRASGIGT